MNQFKIILLGVASIISTIAFSQEEWKLVKDKDSIKIYTKTDELSSLKSFKSTTYLRTNMATFVATLFDVEGFESWGYKIKDTKILERKGDTIQIYYAKSKVSFPFKDRDGIYKNTFRWNAKSKTLTVLIDVLPDYLKENKSNVRVKGNGYWELKQVSENKIFVTFILSLDPGGGIPSWLVNMFVTDSPYTTLFNLREEVKRRHKSDYYYDFLD